MIMIIIIIIIIITKVFALPGRIYFFKNSNFHRFVKTILTDQQTILTDLLKNIYVQFAK